mmetsp:Transcript_37278/g.110096  ORF Transcript_37278/g.110096 Transcript_37278/m.110096 type:complete len:81 (+) Transcript_37278:1086-1328(+)
MPCLPASADWADSQEAPAACPTPQPCMHPGWSGCLGHEAPPFHFSPRPLLKPAHARTPSLLLRPNSMWLSQPTPSPRGRG